MTRSLKGFTGDLRGRLEALEQVTRQARQSTTAAGQGEGFVSSHRGRVANVLQFYSAGKAWRTCSDVKGLDEGGAGYNRIRRKRGFCVLFFACLSANADGARCDNEDVFALLFEENNLVAKRERERDAAGG